MYKLGDKVVVAGVESVISYVNNGLGWVTPIKDRQQLDKNGTQTHLAGCAFATIDLKTNRFRLL